AARRRSGGLGAAPPRPTPGSPLRAPRWTVAPCAGGPAQPPSAAGIFAHGVLELHLCDAPIRACGDGVELGSRPLRLGVAELGAGGAAIFEQLAPHAVGLGSGG